MTTRDRMVLIAVVVLVVLAGGWVLVVSPERHKAAAEQAQVQSAHGQLETAKSQANSARAAERRYNAAYSSVVSLGKAVPPSEEVPSLIYELELASDQRHIEFSSITTGSANGSGSSSGGEGSTAAAASASATPTAFTPMPFTFVFKGSFEGLAHLLGQIDGFAQRNTTGHVTVDGRLLTIQGADITVQGSGSSTSVSSGALSATITATAYVLPASQGLTGGATAAGPSTTTTTTTSAAGSSAAPTTPAVVKATP